MTIIEYFGYVLLYAYLIIGLFYFTLKGFSNLFSIKLKIKENIIPTIGLVANTYNSSLDDIFYELGIESME